MSECSRITLSHSTLYIHERVVPNPELQFPVRGREVKSKGLTTQSCPDLSLALGDNADCLAEWLRDWLHIVNVIVYLVCQRLLSDPVQEFPGSVGT